jgi:hypothetical protein
MTTADNLDVAATAAQEVYDNWDNELWRNAFIFALGQHVANQIQFHQAEIQAALNEVVNNHAKKVKKSVAKAYVRAKLREVAKNQAHEPAGAPGGHGGEFTPKKGPKYAGSLGDATPQSNLGSKVPGFNFQIPQRESLSGEPEPSDRMRFAQGPQENLNAAQDHAMQIAHAYSNLTNGRAQPIQYTIVNNKGDRRFETHEWPGAPDVATHERISHIRGVGYVPSDDVTLGESSYNVAHALGASEARSGQAGAIADGLNQTISQREWGSRLTAASKVLFHATNGVAGPQKVQTAVAVGHAVGRHGPEVTKVLGPHMRRYTYRYNGTEAAPTQYYDLAKEKPDNVDKPTYEYMLSQQLANGRRKPVDPDNPNGMTEYWGGLPSDSEIELQLKSGGMPPSEGFLLDKKGKVRQQAVGAADDWYVPFNLRNIHHLNGGSYVRTRAYGGPTTEDMHLAVMGGANRITTVSKNGIFTVEFFERTGAKKNRFGPVQTRMVNRYGRTLDAVKAGNVPDPDGGTHVEDFRDTAGVMRQRNVPNKLKLDGHGYATALRALQQKYPYYIKSVTYRPAEGEPALQGHGPNSRTADRGYIRPKYLKPAEAVRGYHDTGLGGANKFDEIEGYRWGVAKGQAVAQAAAAAVAAQGTQNRPVSAGSAAAVGGQWPGQTRSATPQGRTEAEQTRIEAGASKPQRQLSQQELNAQEKRVAEFMGHARELMQSPHVNHDTSLAGYKLLAPLRKEESDQLSDSEQKQLVWLHQALLSGDETAVNDVNDYINEINNPKRTGLDIPSLETDYEMHDRSRIEAEDKSEDHVGATELGDISFSTWQKDPRLEKYRNEVGEIQRSRIPKELLSEAQKKALAVYAAVQSVSSANDEALKTNDNATYKQKHLDTLRSVGFHFDDDNADKPDEAENFIAQSMVAQMNRDAVSGTETPEAQDRRQAFEVALDRINRAGYPTPTEYDQMDAHEKNYFNDLMMDLHGPDGMADIESPNDIRGFLRRRNS